MDVQSSDGHGMLLKYVSSYATKAHDAYKWDCLYTPHTSSFEAAFRHLKEMAPLEPEMWLYMSSKKLHGHLIVWKRSPFLYQKLLITTKLCNQTGADLRILKILHFWNGFGSIIPENHNQ
jgi:hypothetical protein